MATSTPSSVAGGAPSAIAGGRSHDLLTRIEAAALARMSPSKFDELRAAGKAPEPHIRVLDRNAKPRRVLWMAWHIELWNEMRQTEDMAAFAKRLQAERRR